MHEGLYEDTLRIAAERAARAKTKKKMSAERILAHTYEVLPLLIACAIDGSTISYKEISANTISKPAQNANVSFGAIAIALTLLSVQRIFAVSGSIPSPTAIVTRTGQKLGGSGAFISAPKRVLSDANARKLWLASEQRAVFDYERWPEVLAAFGLRSLQNFEPKFDWAVYGRAHGEGDEHRKLKKFVSEHPECVEASFTGIGETELILHSLDRLDVSFSTNTTWDCVEVKPSTSDDNDLLRGIFQVVKYKALLRATLLMRGQVKSVRCVLALGGPAPHVIKAVARQLSVAVYDDLERIMRARR